MAGIWIIAETNPDGSLARSATEIGTLGRTLAEKASIAATGVVIAPDPAAAYDVPRTASSKAPSQQAAAGTSLIG